MHLKLFVVTAVLALTAVPAVAQDGKVMRDPQGPFRVDLSADQQCFNGRSISGVSRSGQSSLYVQARTGAIYSLALSQDCATDGSVKALSLRAGGSDVICTGDDAELVARTEASVKRCRVSQVRRVRPGEATAWEPPGR